MKSASDYSYTKEASQNFAAPTVQQQNAAMFAIEVTDGNDANDGFSVEGFTNLAMAQGTSDTANLRFGQSDAPATAYAYMPGTYAQAGDMWFGRNYDYTNAQAGNYAWHTVLHEIGHALGLKHGHEAKNGFSALPADYDSLEYSVMTYRTYEGGSAGSYSYSYWSAPQTYMMADIAALQQLYGADYNTNSGDTVYKWTPGSGDTLVNGDVGVDAGGTVIFATIWDGGGVDTYDLRAYKTSMTIDLAPGGSSDFNAGQNAYLGASHYAEGNIYNAFLYQDDTRSLIENVKAGSGSDTIGGNVTDNKLIGRAGNDDISGLEGNDVLKGGTGNDWLDGGAGDDLLIGGKGSDIFHFVTGEGSDTIRDFDAGSDRIELDGFGFASTDKILDAAHQDGKDVIIDLGTGETLTLYHTKLGDISASDFEIA